MARDPRGGYTSTAPADRLRPPPAGPAPGANGLPLVDALDPARDPDAEPPRPGRDPLEAVARELLSLIGEDPDRAGLVDTPRRFAAWWREFTNHDAGVVDTTFDSIHVDQMVAVTGVRVWSLCEHHLLPFHADLTMAYLAADRVLGLSKFARIANAHAHRLQVQERLVTGIADDLAAITGADSVAVVAQGEHLCMTMRGVKAPATMHSSVMRGAFRTDPEARAELFTLTRRPR